MSDNERINLFNSLTQGLAKATRQMLERKTKLGETVVVADPDGNPITIPAQEALRRLNSTPQ